MRVEPCIAVERTRSLGELAEIAQVRCNSNPARGIQKSLINHAEPLE